MSTLGALIRFARQVDMSVVSQLTQQLNIVREQALAPLRSMVQAVVGGMWRGDGAVAFVDELSSLMIPGVGRVGDDIQLYNRNLQHAVEIIDNADRQVTSMANSLGDIFAAVY